MRVLRNRASPRRQPVQASAAHPSVSYYDHASALAVWNLRAQSEKDWSMSRCATGKVRHPTKEAACVAAKRFKSNLLNVYRCGRCEGWHIGNSSSQFRFQKRIDQILARDKRRASSPSAKAAGRCGGKW